MRTKVLGFIGGAAAAAAWAYATLFLFVHLVLNRHADPQETLEFYLVLVGIPLAFFGFTQLGRRTRRSAAVIKMSRIGFATTAVFCVLLVTAMIFQMGY